MHFDLRIFIYLYYGLIKLTQFNDVREYISFCSEFLKLFADSKVIVWYKLIINTCYQLLKRKQILVYV